MPEEFVVYPVNVYFNNNRRGPAIQLDTEQVNFALSRYFYNHGKLPAEDKDVLYSTSPKSYFKPGAFLYKRDQRLPESTRAILKKYGANYWHDKVRGYTFFKKNDKLNPVQFAKGRATGEPVDPNVETMEDVKRQPNHSYRMTVPGTTMLLDGGQGQGAPQQNLALDSAPVLEAQFSQLNLQDHQFAGGFPPPAQHGQAGQFPPPAPPRLPYPDGTPMPTANFFQRRNVGPPASAAPPIYDQGSLPPGPGQQYGQYAPGNTGVGMGYDQNPAASAARGITPHMPPPSSYGNPTPQMNGSYGPPGAYPQVNNYGVQGQRNAL